MDIRKPLVAGTFYPATAGDCRDALDALQQQVDGVGDIGNVSDVDGVGDAVGDVDGLPGRLYGGIVPHAGWMCSGVVAARVFAALSRRSFLNRRSSPDTVVLLGAVHRWAGRAPAMYGSGAWETPLGIVEVDADLAGHVAQQCRDLTCRGMKCRGLKIEPAAHAQEHSLEVQMPMVKHWWPAAKVLPIMVPPTEDSADFGQALGLALESAGTDTVVVGSTDLTHYGPAYGFEPAGAGPAGLRWAKEVNDRGMIELISHMDAGAIVAEAREKRNACGSGAVASTIAAVAARGADRALVLEHTTSHEVLGGTGREAVGYVGVVFAAGS